MVPFFETHVIVPLEDRNVLPDILSLVGGTAFGLGRRSLFGVAFESPVTGPKPFNFEWQAYFSVFY